MLYTNKLGSVRITNPALSFTFDIRKTVHLNVDIQRVTPDMRLRVDFNGPVLLKLTTGSAIGELHVDRHTCRQIQVL
jgi:hypothetical protein